MIRFVRHSLTKSRWRGPLINSRHKGLRSTDVFIAAYPRSGSTWLRFLLYNILAGEDAEFESVNRDLPDIGRHGQARALLPPDGRLIKTHEAYRPEYRRAVYLYRDARDVVLSEFRYQLRRGIFRRDFPTFVSQFLDGRVNGYGAWDEHIVSWERAARAAEVHIYLLKFEALRRDPVASLEGVLEFIGEPAPSKKAKAAVEANTLEKMREKEKRAKNSTFRGDNKEYPFIFQGQIGSWKNKLNPDLDGVLSKSFGPVLERLGYLPPAE